MSTGLSGKTEANFLSNDSVVHSRLLQLYENKKSPSSSPDVGILVEVHLYTFSSQGKIWSLVYNTRDAVILNG